MSKYVNPPRFDRGDLTGMVDPDGGFLCMTMHWRPDPEAADPEMPGEKLSMSSFIPLSGRKVCLCGSGKRYRDCCQQNRLWHPVCPNPGGPDNGYRLVKPQRATFRNFDGGLIREQLVADRRLRCTDTSPISSFWILFGDPPVEEQYGILCFGDIEFERNRTLAVSAMSDLRMQTLLALLHEVAGDMLGEPRISYDVVMGIDKSTNKMCKMKVSEPGQRSKRRRRRRQDG
ncbi:MAG: hypothetical protein GY832_29650 [Chloroflexi bacterium]|nr:hypothetical protein [Chloroflexota bacterium]